MKRRIIMLLAWILAALLICSFTIFEIKAAPKFSFGYSFTEYLRQGINTSVPSMVAASTPDNTVTVKWKLVKPDDTALDSGTYMLSYPLTDDVFVQVYVTKTLQRYSVKYALYKPDTNMLGVEFQTGLPVLASDDYLIYNGLTTLPNYVPLESLVLDGTGFSAEREAGTNIPIFTVSSGYGFTFMYKGVTVSFKIINGEFQYTTSGIELGRIYDFNLYFTQSASFGTANSASLTVCTGVSGFRSVTKASDYKTAAVPINLKANPPEKTADTENRVNISFDIPKIWSEIRDSFNNITGYGFVFDRAAAKARYGDIPVTVSMDATETERYQLLVNSVFDVSFTATDPIGDLKTRVNAPAGIGYRNDQIAQTPYIDSSGERMVLEIGALPAGLIYNNVRVSFDASARENTGFKARNIAYGVVYTFLKYDIVAIKDRYYAVAQPYKGVQGTYSLYFNDEQSSSVYSNGTDQVTMPLTFVPSIPASGRFQLKFSLDSVGSSVTIVSQMVNFKTDVSDITISTPADFEVINYELVVRDEIQNPADWQDISDLKLDLRWEITSLKLLKKLLETKTSITVRYDLINTLSPGAAIADVRTYGSVDITIRRIGTGDVPQDYEISYAPVGVTPLFIDTDPNGEFAGTRDFTKAHDFIYRNETDDYTLRAYIRLDIETVYKHATAAVPSQPIFFYYPNIYFLSVKPTQLQLAGDLTPTELIEAPSLYDSITLNDVSALQVPPPQLLNITENENTGTEVLMKVNWTAPIRQINEYMSSLPKYDSNLYGYDIYICQNEKALKDFMSRLESELKDGTHSFETIANANCYSYDLNHSEAGQVDLSAGTAANGLSDSGIIRDLLRDGKIVRIKNIPIEDNATELQDILNRGSSVALAQKLTGLDKNQKYYFSAGMSIGFLKSGLVKRINYSKLTGIISETTPGDKEIPKPEERVPVAPVIDKRDVTQNSAIVFWNSITEPPTVPLVPVKITYELLRLRDKGMEKSLTDARMELSELFALLDNSDKLGLFCDSADTLYMMTQNGSISPASSLISISYGDTIALTDESLVPNNLYYYYVRTVKVVNGKTLYSVWNAVSVTTRPVQSPINLKYEKGMTDYDKKTEAKISFDAPLPQPVYQAATDTVSDYRFEVSVKLDNGEWGGPKILDSRTLADSASASATSGYYHFIYKLTGLLPGKTYFVRVRMIDLNNQASVYSNTVEIRTELSQKDYDEELANRDWLDFLKDKLTGAIRESVWSAETSTVHTVIYRPVTFSALMSASKDSGFALAAPSGNSIEYYIPLQSLKLLQEANRTLTLSFGGMEIAIPARAIDLSGDSLAKLNELVKAKTISDVYLCVTVSAVDFSGRINGHTPLSKQVTLGLQLIGSVKTTPDFDAAVYDAIVEIVAAHTEDSAIKAQLKSLITSGAENTELVKFVESVTAKSKNEISNKIMSLRAGNMSGSYTVTPTKPLVYRYVSSVDIAKGYLRSATGWTEQNTTDTGLGKAFSAGTGMVLFAGGKLDIPALNNLNNSGEIISIVAKYGLTDIFGSDMQTTRNATVGQFAATAARIAGAAKGQDAFDYLKAKGIALSASRSNTAITKQEALYVLAGVYEIKTGKKISTMVITNYSLTGGIKGIDSKYLKSVQAAFQLGLYTDKNMNPKSPATVGDTLQMLVNLGKKVK